VHVSSLKNAGTETTRDHDVCVVGAGPVGIALALECAARGLTVALLDAGHDRENPDADDASRASFADPRRHVPMDLAVRRGFGGTSWLWGGRCVPFNEIDFERRDFMPHSGWPIESRDMRSWYEAAVGYLDCGDTVFDTELPDWVDATGQTVADKLEHFAKTPQRALDLRARIDANPLIDVMMECPVTGLNLSADGSSVVSLCVGGVKPRAVRAARYALACGGLETTRLLLLTQRAHPGAFGGEDGPLGRYYMGHFEGTIANVVLTKPRDIHDFDYQLDSTGGYIRRLLAIGEATQRREQVQNIVFWPDNRPFYDPSHRSGIKSLIFLLAETPGIGHRLVSEGIRLGIVGAEPRRYAPHVLNVLLDPITTVKEVWGIIHDRFISKRRKPGWLLPTPDNKYVLHYRGEQRPRPDSRVTLSDDVDQHGMARLRVDLRYSEEDALSAVRAHDILDRSLRANGKGRLEYIYPAAERVERILEQASDGYHQLGTTRMGIDPRSSVVDFDCRAHGVDNLFLATCGVFPTSGHANPTLLATALAARLADQLATGVARSEPVATLFAAE
jgi:glycine/D-amino acid oxidase-like deaminating enzyme